MKETNHAPAPLDFSDLEDKEMWENVRKSGDKTQISQAPIAKYEEKCTDCQNGTFYSYTGRPVGPCFKCKGTGIRKFKTSPETRNRGRKAAAERKKAHAEQVATAVAEFAKTNPAEFGWLMGNDFDFANSLRDSLMKFGSLTEKQLAAVQKCVARDNERAAARAERNKGIDISGGALQLVVKAFNDAADNGLRRPKLFIGDFKISLAGANSANSGSLYVTRNEVYIGKIVDSGNFVQTRACTNDDVDALAEIGKDPFAAAQIHGKQTGVCSCCNRELTNELSVELGIGPICRGKWGW